VSRDGLTSAQLLRGHAYRCAHGNSFAHGEAIKIESIGPRHVRYREWWNSEFDATLPGRWGTVRRHPRVLFDSWDGYWHEVEGPSA
jgi:hypothetical protein